MNANKLALDLQILAALNNMNTQIKNFAFIFKLALFNIYKNKKIFKNNFNNRVH